MSYWRRSESAVVKSLSLFLFALSNHFLPKPNLYDSRNFTHCPGISFGRGRSCAIQWMVPYLGHNQALVWVKLASGWQPACLMRTPDPWPSIAIITQPKSSKPSTYHTTTSQNYEILHQLISNLSDLCLLLHAFIFLDATLAAEEEVMEGGRLVICWWSNDLLLLHQTISRDNGGQEEAPGLPTLSPLHSALHWNTQIQTLKNAYTNMEIDKYKNWKIQTQTMKYKSANVDKDANGEKWFERFFNKDW